MQNIVPKITTPPVAPSLPPFRERLETTHRESVSAGATGPLVLFLCSLSSAVVLLGKGLVFLYNRVRGYA